MNDSVETPAMRCRGTVRNTCYRDLHWSLPLEKRYGVYRCVHAHERIRKSASRLHNAGVQIDERLSEPSS